MRDKRAGERWISKSIAAARFLFQAEVDGWESRETTFCRIPDLAAITRGEPTRLGFTVHAAAQLGARTQQMFPDRPAAGTRLPAARSPNGNRSSRGRSISRSSRGTDSSTPPRANNVQTVITIYDPPAWVMPAGKYRRLPDVSVRSGCLSRFGHHRVEALSRENSGAGNG